MLSHGPVGIRTRGPLLTFRQVSLPNAREVLYFPTQGFLLRVCRAELRAQVIYDYEEAEQIPYLYSHQYNYN